MHLAIVGTGFIGGSFALAARANGLFRQITGIEPDAARGRRALELGLVDALAATVPPDADAVLLAGPSHSIAPWVIRLAGHGGILFDTGSVKAALVHEVETRLGTLPARFVPAHPLAGSERSGPDSADAGLFEEAEVILTPTTDTDAAAVRQVQAWWQAVGARVCTMDADQHDRVLAMTSHLPHLLAFTYLQLVDEGHLPHTAGGFRDFTRIGASDAGVWGPIFRQNRAVVLEMLDRFEAELQRVRALLDGVDDAALEAFLRQAARRRGLPSRRAPPVGDHAPDSRSADRSHSSATDRAGSGEDAS